MEFLRREKRLEYADEIWILNVDVLTDYNSYFSEHNPNLLRERFNREARIIKKMTRIHNYQGLQRDAYHTDS